jgi:hypothetical protein
MKTITHEQAYGLLANCSAIVWDNSFLSYPSLIEDDERFLELSADTEDGTFEVAFEVAANQNVRINGSAMFLTDTDGDEQVLSLLSPANLEDELEPGKETPVLRSETPVTDDPDSDPNHCPYCGSAEFDERGDCRQCG